MTNHPMSVEWNQVSGRYYANNSEALHAFRAFGDRMAAELDRLNAENERLRTALERYGEHETCCVKGDACDCGLSAALAGGAPDA